MTNLQIASFLIVKTECFLPNVMNKIKLSILITSTDHCTRGFNAIKASKVNKWIQNGEEKVKLLL